MQYLKKSGWYTRFSVLSNVHFAQHTGAAAVPMSCAYRLHFAVLVESLTQNRFCIVQGSVADDWLPPHLVFRQFSNVSEDGARHMERLRNVKRCFKFAPSIGAFPGKSDLTPIRSRSSSQDEKEERPGAKGYISTSYGVEGVLEHDPERFAASRLRVIFEA